MISLLLAAAGSIMLGILVYAAQEFYFSIKKTEENDADYDIIFSDINEDIIKISQLTRRIIRTELYFKSINRENYSNEEMRILNESLSILNRLRYDYQKVRNETLHNFKSSNHPVDLKKTKFIASDFISNQRQLISLIESSLPKVDIFQYD